jgi:hypothetical protein
MLSMHHLRLFAPVDTTLNIYFLKLWPFVVDLTSPKTLYDYHYLCILNISHKSTNHSVINEFLFL